MKMFFTFLAALVTLAAGRAQMTTPADDSLEAYIARQRAQRPAEQRQLLEAPEKPNEIKIDGVTYSGIAVQLFKADNPAQLINPAAPPEYGSPEQNVARDPITGKITGLKIFSISF